MIRTIIYKPDFNRTLTQEEIQMLDALEHRPVVIDEDSPELTPATEAAIIEARRRKPLKTAALKSNRQGTINRGEMVPVTIYLSQDTIARAAALDHDSGALMSRLLTDALRALDTRR